MKAVFMGTPEFAVTILDGIVNAGHSVVAVVTQPDRPAGRGMAPVFSPVKKRAEELSIDVFGPQNIKDAAFVKTLESLAPDVIAVAAYGQILSGRILSIPKYGCINAHASLLPSYRGASPIQAAILDGCAETGVTIMKMDRGLDTGDILMQGSIPIADDETGGTLTQKLALLAAGLLPKTLAGLESGMPEPRPQGDGATYAGIIKKAAGRIDWSRDAKEIERMIRAYDPWPGTWCFRDGKMLKIHRAAAFPDASDTRPGNVAYADRDSFGIKCGSGVLFPKIVQPAGKKAMDVSAYLRGKPVACGESFL